MREIDVPCNPDQPALLLLEPDTFWLSARAMQLNESEFCVTRAYTAEHVHRMRGVFAFSVAVLSDGMGFLALRDSAHVVRAQWPKARIVILGRAPQNFDDWLYDETVLHASDASHLLKAVRKFAEDSRNRTGYGSYPAWSARARLTSQLQSSAAQESDPTKVPGHIRKAEDARDWPAVEQFRQRAN